MDRQSALDVTPDDIRALVSTRQRETNTLEFKGIYDSGILKESCGIANAGGGFILVGIDEDEKHCAKGIIPVLKVESVCDSFRQTVRDGLSPRPVLEVVPLTVDGSDIIVARISPQNPPHMVSSDKRTDFWGRWDATTEKMRYDDIDRRFYEKHRSGLPSADESKGAVIETIGGRTTVSAATDSVLRKYAERMRRTDGSAFALLAISEENTDYIENHDAIQLLMTPLYDRHGGWLVAYPQFEVISNGALWSQRFDEGSVTTLNPSGDCIFLKRVDHILCWTQSEEDFKRSPRLYPNAIAEYCLSFSYFAADTIARTLPKKLYLAAYLVNSKGSTLPKGEGGSVWLDSPTTPPHRLETDSAEGPYIVEVLATGRPFFARNVAFKLASQIYSFFNYSPEDVAFASHNEIIVESDPDVATTTALRAYLQNVFGTPFGKPVREPNSGNVSLRSIGRKNVRIGATEEFIDDHHWYESKFYTLLDSYDLPSKADKLEPGQSILIANEELIVRDGKPD